MSGTSHGILNQIFLVLKNLAKPIGFRFFAVYFVEDDEMFWNWALGSFDLPQGLLREINTQIYFAVFESTGIRYLVANFFKTKKFRNLGVA